MKVSFCKGCVGEALEELREALAMATLVRDKGAMLALVVAITTLIKARDIAPEECDYDGISADLDRMNEEISGNITTEHLH